MVIKPRAMVNRVRVEIAQAQVLCTWTQFVHNRMPLEVTMVVTPLFAVADQVWGLQACVSTPGRGNLAAGVNTAYNAPVTHAEMDKIVKRLAHESLMLCEDNLIGAMALTTAADVLTRPALRPALHRLCTMAADGLRYACTVAALSGST